MTTVSTIITDAYRQSNVLAIATSPTSDQTDEGLRYLNRIVKSVFGNEAGDPFESFPIGRVDIQRPAGYPWWNNVPDNNWWVPKNTRLMVNIDEPVEVWLHPDPDDGSRFAVIDVQKTFATNNFTVHGNGRLIEGLTSMVLNADGTDSEWFYRADIGNWQLYSPLSLVDTFPFPEEFDDFFITLLAMRLNPAYGVQMDGQSQAVFNRAAKQMKARYDQDMPTRSELGLLRMPRTSRDRNLWGDSYWLYNPNSMFEKGWPF